MPKNPKNTQIGMMLPLVALKHNLLAWYDQVAGNREMPWRQMRDPYAIWLSETMLQQTQVETVKPYFARFLERFPTVLALAEAELDNVLAMWAGLGYYRRARHLHAAAKMMVEKHGARVPAMVAELLELPGVGRYTAGAVASIAFSVAAPVVDGNVMRVIARLTGFEGNIADPKNAAYFWEVAEQIVRGMTTETRRHEDTKDHEEEDLPKKELQASKKKANHESPLTAHDTRYGDLNQAMMELGATVCVPVRPACLTCPVREFCRAFAEGRQEELPVKAKKKAVPEVRGVAVVVLRKGKETGHEVLLMKRPRGGVWEGMWEFPVFEGSWKLGVGSWKEAIGRELGIRMGKLLARGEVIHTLTHRQMRYDVVRTFAEPRGKVKLPACREGGRYEAARWVPWPLVKDRNGLAWGTVVEKIARAAVDHAVGAGKAAGVDTASELAG